MKPLPWLQTLSAMHCFPPFSVLWRPWHPLSYSNGMDILCIAVWPKWTCITIRKSLIMLEIIHWNCRQLNLPIGVFIPFQWLISTFSHTTGMSAFWSIFIGNKFPTLSWLPHWSFSFWSGPLNFWNITKSIAFGKFKLLIWIKQIESSRFFFSLGLNFKAFERASNYNTYGLRILPKESFIYIAHAAFLATFAFFCIHVQVATRMLASSTPVIYWWMALLTTPNDRKPMHQSDSKYPRLEVLQKLETKENMASIWKNLVFDEVKLIPKEWRILFNYCCIYACLGTVLFANFLPWT